MKRENKLLKGMLLGAIVGGSVALFDRETRRQTVANLKTTGEEITTLVKHPSDTVQRINESLAKLNTNVKAITTQVLTVIEKVNEVKGSMDRKERDSSSALKINDNQ